MGKKIVFIGAGSTQFASTVLGDIFWFDDLDISEIALVDLNIHKAEVMKHVCENYAKQKNREVKITVTDDRRSVLPGADFVINCIAVGGAQRYKKDLEIADKYGVNYNVGDIIGATAIFRMIREYPDILGMCKDIEELCPNAYFFNYSNPMAPVMTALYQQTNIKTFGICHNVQETWEALANYLDVDRDRVTYWCAGINHMDWFLQLKVDGEDAYPRLKEISKTHAEQQALSKKEVPYHESNIDLVDTVRFEIMHKFGYFPSESPFHMSEYCPFFRKNDDMIKYWEVENRWWLAHELRADDTIDKMQKYLDENKDIPIKKSDEYVPELIHALCTGKTFRANLNVSNKAGLISNLPRGCVVEVPCYADGEGIHPAYVGELPEQLAALNRANSTEQILMAKAVVEKKKQYIYQAVAMDPLASANCTLEQIHDMMTELIESNAADGYLDGWTD